MFKCKGGLNLWGFVHGKRESLSSSRCAEDWRGLKSNKGKMVRDKCESSPLSELVCCQNVFHAWPNVFRVLFSFLHLLRGLRFTHFLLSLRVV